MKAFFINIFLMTILVTYSFGQSRYQVTVKSDVLKSGVISLIVFSFNEIISLFNSLTAP